MPARKHIGQLLLATNSVLWMLLLCGLPFTFADTLKLKDGTVVQGTILDEDNQQITVEVSLADGTIQTKRTYRKSDVIGISRLTPEQRAEREMLEAQEKAFKYQLSPGTSYPLTYYDDVMKNVFRPFLATYPSAPKAKQVKGLLDQWQAERDQVADGRVKVDGEWMSATAATEKSQQEQILQILQQARSQIGAGEYLEAIEICKTVLTTSRDPERITEAKALSQQARDKWIHRLTLRREWIHQQIQATKQQIEHASEVGARAANRVTFRNTAGGNAVKTLGKDVSAVVADTMDKQRKQAEEQLAALQEKLATVEQQIDEAKTRPLSLPGEANVQLAQDTLTNQIPVTAPTPPSSVKEAERSLPKWIVPALVVAGIAFVLWLVFGK